MSGYGNNERGYVNHMFASDESSAATSILPTREGLADTGLLDKAMGVPKSNGSYTSLKMGEIDKLNVALGQLIEMLRGRLMPVLDMREDPRVNSAGTSAVAADASPQPVTKLEQVFTDHASTLSSHVRCMTDLINRLRL